LTQRFLKPWWPWTYQNSAVKRASTRVVPGWVTSWEVWFWGAKSRQYCVVGVGCYKLYESHCPAWDAGSMPSPWECAYMYKPTFLTQHVLKPWWPWTYQNSAVKYASTGVVPGWVTSWEVWFGGAKSEQDCVVGVGHYKCGSYERWRSQATVRTLGLHCSDALSEDY